MTFQFKKATKQQAKLRMAIFGPSGAGKTFTALRVATGIGGRIAVIDTERGSASKYSDRFDFDVLELEDANIDVYQQAIRAAGQGGYNVLILDSLSHAWQELLIEIDKLASTKFGGNTWAAWSKGTPKQRQFIDAILDYPGHIIATMRVKTEWVEGERNGKKTYTRVGLNPEQGKGIEYEFDLLLELSVEHIGMVAKDRTGKFQDKTIDKPGEGFGRELVAWLNDGSPAPKLPEPPAPQPATVAAAVELGGEVREGAAMTLETAEDITNSDGVRYGDLDSEKLAAMTIGIGKAMNKTGLTPEQRETYQLKLDAIATILQARNGAQGE
jgi:hypothetical protein